MDMFKLKVNAVVRETLDLIYPDSLYCICCGKIIDGSRPYRLCDPCMRGIKWATGRCCRKCGKPLSDQDPADICYSCREHDHIFDQGYTCAEYGTHERALIFALKYDGKTDVARTIAEMMRDRMSTIFDRLPKAYDLVIPVPMYGPKQKDRGFNQADLIARQFAEMCGLPYDDGILVRTRGTRAMRGLTPLERQSNLQDAFALAGESYQIGKYCIDEDAKELEETRTKIHGKTILLVDDIYTTGATSDAIARVLKWNGARQVDILSFAAGADVVKSS